MRRHDAVRVRLGRRVGLGRAVGAAGIAVVDQRLLLVGRVAVRVHADPVDAVDAVAALRDVGGREAPVAVAGLAQPVVDLRARGHRVVGAPAPRPPAFLGHEQRRHQRLEHAAAPRWRHAHARVRERALEDRLAEVGAGEADGLRLDAAVVGEGAERAVVVARRQLALLDPDVARDPALGDDRVVAAGCVAAGGRVVEEDLVALGPVVEAEVHRVEQRLRARPQLRHPVGDDAEADREPAVVDRGEPRRDGVAARRGRGERARCGCRTS